MKNFPSFYSDDLRNLTESLFSNNPHVIDKSPNTNIVKIGKNKFVSVIKPLINKEKKIIPTPTKQTTDSKKKTTGYDLNDYDYDCDFEDRFYS